LWKVDTSENLEYEGAFWRPENEQEAVVGRLNFNPLTGGTLSLFGF
jgi:hypothetical protein